MKLRVLKVKKPGTLLIGTVTGTSLEGLRTGQKAGSTTSVAGGMTPATSTGTGMSITLMTRSTLPANKTTQLRSAIRLLQLEL